MNSKTDPVFRLKEQQSTTHQTLSRFDVGQLDLFQAGRLAHQGVGGGPDRLITDAVENLRLHEKKKNPHQNKPFALIL